MRTAPLALLMLCLGAGLPVRAPAPAPAHPPAAPVARSSPRDFDFEFGTWTTRLRVLRHPLTGSSEWVEYQGTTVVRKVWDGRANLVELVAEGPAGRIEALSLRLYDPAAAKWSLNFANSGSGALSPPSVGEFRNGRGEFLSRETLDGRPILVRFVIEPVARDTIRFEQAFSADEGRSWEVNWRATDTR
ncbi:MAG TPA: hypothetical protein VFN40_05260 [Gemmatimonadales bacterium]|nr:hypothetical protein [Gemmatimonadales bacterium]